MELLKFLTAGNPNERLSALASELGIKVVEYKIGDKIDRYVLNYSQSDSPKAHPIVVECRGIVLDKDFNVICRPFDRFFNLGEHPQSTDNLDMRSAVAFEKVDGSFIKIYHYSNNWEIATRGSAFGETQVFDFGFCFRELVLRALKLTEDEFQEKANSLLDKEVTYMFEVTSVENRVVTRYEGYDLHYLGARVTKTGQHVREREKSAALALGSKDIKDFKFESTEEALAAANALKNLEEGFVIWVEQDGEFKPVSKVKSKDYLIAHYIRGEGLTVKKIVELVLAGETEEYLAYFENDRVHFKPYLEALAKLKNDMQATLDELEHIQDKKEFAKAVAMAKLPYQAVIFACRNFNQTVDESFEKQFFCWRREILELYVSGMVSAVKTGKA